MSDNRVTAFFNPAPPHPSDAPRSCWLHPWSGMPGGSCTACRLELLIDVQAERADRAERDVETLGKWLALLCVVAFGVGVWIGRAWG